MEPGFLGFVDLEDTLVGTLLVTNSSWTPIDADALPNYRIYGPNGFLQAGSVTRRDSGSLTGASNASPISVTSALHGLTTGAYITITGVTGNTAANGTWLVTKVDDNTFTLDDATGNNSYISGGEWHLTGLYGVSIVAQGVSGFEKSEVYQIVYTYEVSSVVQEQLHSFQVS